MTPENFNVPNNGIWVFTFKDWNSLSAVPSEVDAYFNLAVFC